MNKLLLFIGLIILLAGATAQTVEKIGPDAPVLNSEHRSRCFQMEVKILRQAVDTSQSLEEMQKEELAARAYGEMDALDQEC